MCPDSTGEGASEKGERQGVQIEEEERERKR